jgi:hypothetical protein
MGNSSRKHSFPNVAPDLSPKEFLKARRPEKFSDSAPSCEPTLDRSILEYHLSTLTNRSQEVAFATFARHLSELEICPNLLPQTGPTGGGDSKVDSETYPVADDLAIGWYVGLGREAAAERWGFAFSAKAKWRDKAISDVEKAVKTGRDYKKIFFISNQYIRDKERAEVEDQLREANGVDVRILDRTWMLDKVFANRHEALAIEDLQIATSMRREIKRGPLDRQRELDFSELAVRIQRALQAGEFTFQVAEDCIESADLARQLERPRAEVDGLYDRAERIAAKCGTNHQLLKCAYERARTAFWWHEDVQAFSQIYSVVEERAKGSQNPYDLEFLASLWSLLQTSVVRGKLDPTQACMSKRTLTLTGELRELSQQEERPSAVLHARSLLLQIQLFLNLDAKISAEPVLREFREVVRNCEGLAGFPLEPLADILIELGDFLGDLPAYQEMFETVVSVQTGRKSDIAAARMLLRRGTQQLAADKPYDAIRTLGMSLRRLYKHESRSDLIRALYLCGCAYERSGLFWAARGTMLYAASLATDELQNHGEVTSAQAACFRRLKWLELQLGRIPHVLSWHEIDKGVRSLLDPKRTERESVDSDTAFDALLGLLFLRTDFWDLKLMSDLPDALDRLGLFSSEFALLYALGYEAEVQDDFFSIINKDQDGNIHDFFLKWRDQPASKSLQDRPLSYEEQKVILKSRLLGCEIVAKCDNSSPCVELGESILGALESLLSTGTVQAMAAREPVLTITIRGSDFAQEPFEFTLDDDTGRPQINISCTPFDPHNLPRPIQETLQNNLMSLLATIFARIVITSDVPRVFERLVRDELALDRSLNFAGSFMTSANVLGKDPKNTVTRWTSIKARRYPSKRTGPWDQDDPAPQGRPAAVPGQLTPGKGDPPKEVIDHSQVKQSEIQTVSLIRDTLWDKARWVGTAFVTEEGDVMPPVLGLVFRDAEAAKQIFHFLNEDLRDGKAEERLRVSIVRGIDLRNPYWYRVLIGTNPDSDMRGPEVRYFVAVSRINTMEATSKLNLERFLSSYGRWNRYILAAAVATGSVLQPEPLDCPSLKRSKLFVRNAWEIGRHDPDSMGVLPDDAPIIPVDQEKPPVIELLQWKKNQSPDGD